MLKGLEEGPLDPEEIRQATGKASRSLGEEGKKKGLTTTLPLALGKLQAAGEIRRVPVSGRLDQQCYLYWWKGNPLQSLKMDQENVATELAGAISNGSVPATVAEFQWVSGLGAKAAKAALEPLKLAPLTQDVTRLITAADRELLEAYQVPKESRYALVAGLDGISLLKRNAKDLIDPQDLKNPLFLKKGDAGGSLTDLPSHGIFDRGRLIGLWEYNTDNDSIAWASFIPKNKDLVQAVEETEQYVRNELGDARSFSLDSPKSRAPRIEALHAMK